MKAIVGVDQEGLYRSALTLLGRLRFPDAEVELIHSEAPLPPFPEAGYMIAPEVETLLNDTAETLLKKAVERASEAGLNPAHHEYTIGSVCGCLLNAADAANADMIAIGSHQKSHYGTLFLGSVGRGLVISAKQSILIAKGAVDVTGPVTAVFATDYSDYAEDAVRQLARMKPAGLSKVILVSAVPKGAIPEPTVLQALESKGQESRYFEEEGRRTVAHLAEAGITSEARVVAGDIHEVIESTMRDEKADLLIMGAHGHGFLERLVLGSESLREAMATHHPILILRPR